MGGPEIRSSIGRAGWLLLAGALALRLAWALTASTELRLDHVFNDATARGIAAGRGFTASLEPPYDPAIFRTPGYSAFVALIYRYVDDGVRTVFVVQAVVDTLTCFLIGRLALRRAGRRTALAALLLAATYPFTIHAVGRLSAETLLVFLATIFVSGVDSWPRRGGWSTLVADGVFLGMLLWVKPVFLPAPAFLVVSERLRGRPWALALGRAAVVGGLALALFAPWVARNDAAFGRPVLAGELGLVVLHGTYDFDEDRDAIIARGFENESAQVPADAGPEARYDATRRRFTSSPAALERDRAHLQEGLERLRANPLRGLLLDPLRRVPRLWVSTTYVGAPAWIGMGAAAACVGYLLLAAWGLWRLRGRLGELAAWWLVPVTLTLGYAALHVEARYTLPARPTLLLLGAAALTVPPARSPDSEMQR
jgi:hypothetical protein